MKRLYRTVTKIFVNHISNKGQVSIKNSLKLNSKTINLITKWTKDVKKHFTKEEIHGKEAHEKMSYIISERQIKVIVHLAKCLKKEKKPTMTAPNAGKDAKKLDNSHVADWNV